MPLSAFAGNGWVHVYCETTNIFKKEVMYEVLLISFCLRKVLL